MPEEITSWKIDPEDWPNTKVKLIGGSMKLDDFFAIVEKIHAKRMALYKRKNADYASFDDGLSNFKRMASMIATLRIGQLPAELIYPWVMVLAKIDRWINLSLQQREPRNEAKEDTAIDLHNYIDIIAAIEAYLKGE